MHLGPIMLDLAGTMLTAEERDLLRQPAVGGVILFSRNCESAAQIAELVAEIHALRDPRLLIGVDQEGGRVQRCRDGFTRLPAVGLLGARYRHDPIQTRAGAEMLGWLMAIELRAVGIDFSFAPVLDLDRGLSAVIGDRSFGAEPDQVCDLAGAWIDGMRRAGMSSVGKHFPGHGGVEADSHLELPVDTRAYADLAMEDLLVFERLIEQGLEAIMPAHVRYSAIAPEPAGFSRFWLTEVLRRRLGFEGAIFSDDLGMGAAVQFGDIDSRADAAIAAGCDMLLICNDRAQAITLVEHLAENTDPVSSLRLLRMRGRGHQDRLSLRRRQHWLQAVNYAAGFEDHHTLDLGLDDPTERTTGA